MSDNLTQLGAISPLPASPDEAVIELAKIQFGSPRFAARFTVPEFTSLCPVTGQPDFAMFVIDYVPRHSLVESKSLKLYLGSFRMAGEFHESCVARIGRDLVTLLQPTALKVEGRFTPRGGIPFWPTFTYSDPAKQD